MNLDFGGHIMKRKALKQIEDWYEQNYSTPLLIAGPKGVGKTYLAFEFLKEYSGNKVYINFEVNPAIKELFESKSIHDNINRINAYFHLETDCHTLIILDEFDLCESILLLLQTNTLQYDNYHFILISSYSQYQPSSSERCGYDLIRLSPLDFEEFLEASSNVWYISVIKEHYYSNHPIPDIVHQDILNLFYEYLITGGMPAALNEYFALNSPLNVSEKHKILFSYIVGTLKSLVSESEYIKICQLIDTIDVQLAKKNKKFQYILIRKGCTRAQFQEALTTLANCDIIYRCPHLTNQKSEKIYLFDTGLLLSKAKVSFPNSVVDLESEFYKGLIENYIAQTLHNHYHELFYWDSGSLASISFVLKAGEYYKPIEVFQNDSTRSKAVSIFKEQYQVNESIKISLKNFSKQKNVKYVPVYASFCI